MARAPKQPPSDLARALVSLMIAAVLALGLLWYFFGRTPSLDLQIAEKEPAVCAKDFACAAKLAHAMGELARDETLRGDAVALEAAYRRKDCAMARELLDDAERVPAVEPSLIAARRKAQAGQAGVCGDPHAPTTEPTAPPVDATLSLERTRSCKDCPAYTLTVHPDGRVDWSGKSGVAAKGAASGKIDRAHARELFDLFERVKFTGLDAEYLTTATDLPLTRIALHRGTTTHSVTADGACQTPAAIEAGVCFLARRIDELAEVRQFIAPRDE
jgi:hypothetical protein